MLTLNGGAFGAFTWDGTTLTPPDDADGAHTLPLAVEETTVEGQGPCVAVTAPDGVYTYRASDGVFCLFTPTA